MFRVIVFGNGRHGVWACLLSLSWCSSIARADGEEELLNVLRETVVARSERLERIAYSATRTFGPTKQLLELNQAKFEFMSAAIKAAGIPRQIEPMDPSHIKDVIEYWHVEILGKRRLLYLGTDRLPTPEAGWSYRELFTGDHWERFTKNAVPQGAFVIVCSASKAPPLLSPLGLEMPPGIEVGPITTSMWLQHLGKNWTVESMSQSNGADGAHLVSLTAVTQKHPTDGLGRRLAATWDMSKEAAPVSMTYELAIANEGKVEAARATRGFRLEWKDYALWADPLWIPGAMIREVFEDTAIVDVGGAIHFVEKDGVRVKGTDGYPTPDFDRQPIRRFVVERERWAISNFSVDGFDDSHFESQYGAGTIVQNDLGLHSEAYQLLGSSSALTTTMREILETSQAQPPRPNRSPFVLLLTGNLIVICVIIGLLIRRRRAATMRDLSSR